MSALTPTAVEKLNDREMLLAWNSGDRFGVPYLELRFFCPCAGCVDEHTGKRTLRRESINADVRPVSVEAVGRYALQIGWSDGHNTGIYHFDTLDQICQKTGRKL